MDVVVVPAVLLDGHVGQVDEQVVHLPHAVVIPHSAESAETKFEEVNLERSEGSHQDVESHVELFPSDQQRVVNIARYHVGLLHQVGVEDGLAFSGPFLQFGKFVDEKYSGSLGLPARLHDPGGVGVLPVLLHEHVVVGGEDEGGGDEVQVEVATLGTFLRQRVPLPLQISPVALDVLHHGVLPGELVVVGEMVDQLEVVHPVAGVHGEQVPDSSVVCDQY